MAKTWDKLYTEIYQSASKKRQIFSATFELTSRCNFQCKMCYVCEQTNDEEIRSKELTAQQWIELGRQARDEGLLYLTLTGGEVFLRPDFREIYEGLVNLGLIVQVLTNASMITPEIMEWLKKMPPRTISITLYGKDAETYRKITGHADGYERTTKAIDMLIENGFNVEIKTTVVHGNIDQYLDLSVFAMERKHDVGIVNYISPRREGHNTDPVGNRLSPAELAEYEEFVIGHNRELASQEKQEGTSFSDALDHDMIPPAETVPSGYVYNKAFHCASGKCAVWIAWDGRMVPCGIMSEPVTYPLEIGMHNAWEELKKECDLIPICGDCVDCNYAMYCDKCPARLKNESGAWDKKADYLCETAFERAKQIQLRKKLV